MDTLISQWDDAAVALGLTLGIAYLASEVVARLARLALGGVIGGEGPARFSGPIVRRPIRIVRVTVFLLTALVLAPPALESQGIRLAYGLELDTLSRWFFESGIRILLIAFLAYMLIRIATIAEERFEETVAQSTEPDVRERVKRAHTLGALVLNAFTIFVIGVSILMVLRELDVDIMPILTGAGIVGLAVGFGAQTLVKDVIAGFFLILENQVRVGDVALVNGTGGLVEAVRLRTVVLRDLAGVVHVFPNGSIERLANMTREFSFCVLDVGVAYKEDTDHVVGVLRKVGEELRGDPTYGPEILEPLEILGVDDFGESEVKIRVRIKTVPIKQWFVGRELRRRIKKAFDAQGIEIPFPHRSIYFGEASKPFAVAADSRA